MPTSALARKLLIKPGQRIGLVNAPRGYAQQLAPLPEGAAVSEGLSDSVEAVHMFVSNMVDLDRHVSVALSAVAGAGLLRIAYPKGGAKTGTDLSRDTLWRAMETAHGWTGVSLVAIDDVWSAMRFRPSDQVGARPSAK